MSSLTVCFKKLKRREVVYMKDLKSKDLKKKDLKNRLLKARSVFVRLKRIWRPKKHPKKNKTDT